MTNIAILDDYQDVALSMADWSVLGDSASITTFCDHIPDTEDLVKALQQFDVVCVMRERTPFCESRLRRLPNLKHIFTPGMRNASIDLKAARELGIDVSGCPTLGYPTVELTWGLILGLARSIGREETALRSGAWQTSVGVGLNGKTLGILGLGRIGSLVANIARSFGMRVIAWSENLTEERCNEVGVEYASKEQLLADSDFVTVHLKLGDRTRNLVSVAEFAAMKNTAFIVNTSRAPIVDEVALVGALNAGDIRGAAIDVFETEPLPSDHPYLGARNMLLTPHLGYVVEENYRMFFENAIENISGWIAGNPKNIIN